MPSGNRPGPVGVGTSVGGAHVGAGGGGYKPGGGAGGRPSKQAAIRGESSASRSSNLLKTPKKQKTMWDRYQAGEPLTWEEEQSLTSEQLAYYNSIRMSVLYA